MNLVTTKNVESTENKLVIVIILKTSVGKVTSTRI